MNIEAALAKARDYVVGVQRQDADLLRATFDETAQITGLDEGKRINVPRDRWVDFVCAPDRAGWGKPDYEIVSVQIAGTVAVVVVDTQYGRFKYRDFLAMIERADCPPMIASKVFHQFE